MKMNKKKKKNTGVWHSDRPRENREGEVWGGREGGRGKEGKRS